MQRLRRRLLEGLEPRTEDVAVRLRSVPMEGVSEALALLTGGKWHEGRQSLEALRPDARTLDDAPRATFYYNLGLARRFDAVTLEQDPDAHFSAAERAFAAAVRLAPSSRHRRALADTERHRQQVRLLAAQRGAGPGNLAPPPPPPLAYRNAAPRPMTSP